MSGGVDRGGHSGSFYAVLPQPSYLLTRKGHACPMELRGHAQGRRYPGEAAWSHTPDEGAGERCGSRGPGGGGGPCLL